MQFGIFTVGDVTADPTTGRTPTEHERIKATVAIAKKAEEVGLDVFATGEHHNPPFVASAPDHARWPTSPRRPTRHHPVDGHHADHHHRPGADRRGLRQAAAPLRRPRRPDDGPRQHRPGLPVVRQGHPRRHPAGDRELPPAAPALARGRRRTGRASSARRCRGSPRRRGRSTAYRRSSGTARSAPPRSPSRRRTTATASSPTTSSGRRRTPQQMVGLYRARFEHYGHGTADQAIVGLGGQVFMRQEQPGRGQRVPAVLRQRAGLRPRPVAGGLHRADAADRRLPAAGDRADARLPGVRRRLPAPAVPDGPRRAAAEDRARAARPARRGGRARAAQGVRGAEARRTCRTRRRHAVACVDGRDDATGAAR